MRILLIGEYSGVHTNLANELKRKGHEVFVISDGDGYKKIGNPDLFIKYNVRKTNIRLFAIILNFYYIILEFIGLKGLFKAFNYVSDIRKLKDYDVVQLINTKPFSNFSTFANIFLLYYIFRKNKKIFLCALGDDYTWVKSCLKKYPPYSMFDRFNVRTIKHYLWSLQYIYGFGAILLDRYVVGRVEKVIPGLYDYYFAYKKMGCKKISDIIPLPIDIDHNMKPIKFTGYPINIFHGWQIGRDFRKGNDYFDLAIHEIIKKYPHKISYEIVSGLPYEEYLKKFNTAHIFLDQCISLDRGMNAVVGMRHGKIVFSGFHKMTQEYFCVKNKLPLVNVSPNIEKIIYELEKLILNPELIEEISKNSIDFIKLHHDADLIVKKYIEIWS